MNARDRISRHFNDSRHALEDALEKLGDTIESSASILANKLAAGGKLLICGNGGSASDALHFSSELINRFEMERPPLAAIALNADVSSLTSIANDYSFEQVYSKQLTALGSTADMLVVFTTSGNSKNINHAVQTAQTMGIPTLALTGKSGGETSKLLGSNDIELRIPNDTTARIQEVHGLIIHCLCDLIDQQLYGDLS